MPKKQLLIWGALLLLAYTARAYTDPPEFLQEEHQLTQPERDSLYTQLKWDTSCEEDYKDQLSSDAEYDMDRPAGNIYKITPQVTLLELPCDYAAYQANYIYVQYNPIALHPDQTMRLVHVQGPPDELPVDAVLGNPDYSFKDNKVRNTSLFRGLGDCGARYEWTYDPAHASLILDKQQVMDCERSERFMQRCTVTGRSADSCFEESEKRWKTTYSRTQKVKHQ